MKKHIKTLALGAVSAIAILALVEVSVELTVLLSLTAAVLLLNYGGSQ